jgi:hypothetical protein
MTTEARISPFATENEQFLLLVIRLQYDKFAVRVLVESDWWLRPDRPRMLSKPRCLRKRGGLGTQRFFTHVQRYAVILESRRNKFTGILACNAARSARITP